MRTQTRAALGVALIAVVAIGAALFFNREGSEPQQESNGAPSALIRDDSRILPGPGGEVTFVEFLDFECEACAAAYPIVEDLREQYADKVTFVVRYFPLGGHFNAERAARAVESAARQDKFEEMYQKMYETQATWGEQKVPLDDLFRTYASDIGLDLATYDADYASSDVAERVQRDVEDGNDLGVTGTPAFFVDGERLEPQSYKDLTDAIDAALAK